MQTLWLGSVEMANSVFNIVPDSDSEHLSPFYVDMAIGKENEFVCDKNNTNATHSTRSVNSLL